MNVRAADEADLARCYDVLLRARVALHLATERPGDVLRLEDQDAAAAQGGWSDADDMMASVADGGPDGGVARRRELGSARSPARTCHRTGPSRRASCCSTARSSCPPERIPPRTRRSCSPRLSPPPVSACASDGSRLDRLKQDVEGWPGNWPVGAPTSWSRCSSKDIGPCRRSRRSTSASSSVACCRSGSRSGRSRSATRTTASPSTGTSGRPPPTPPSSPTASAGRTCS